jgi:dTDP-4-amino-4,6-dideoxygalactose transaminase
MGSRYAVAVTSCTAALICSLTGLGIGPGDEVIVPAYTWIASVSAVVAVGAVPVLAEVDESLTLDPVDVIRKITSFTRAIMPVHMRGAPAQMDALLHVAKQYNLKVIEDTAQANGASYHGRRLGTLGDVGAFSLQFNKIITSGEGGLITTSDETLYRRIQMYQDVVGGIRNNIPADQILPGVNYRMPELLAAVALVQLGRLESLLADMRQRKKMIKDSLTDAARRQGVQFRVLNDPDGEAAIALIFFAPEAGLAQRISDGLAAEGISNFVMFSPAVTDYHVYAHWTPILGQRTWSEHGGPWKNHPRPVSYTTEMCPRTLDLLSRAVHIDISPELDSQAAEEIVEGLTRVWTTVA